MDNLNNGLRSHYRKLILLTVGLVLLHALQLTRCGCYLNPEFRL